jgi:hypothetical protein
MRKKVRTNVRRKKLFRFERLEERSLLAVAGLGGDVLVNSFLPGPQATAEAGSAVAVTEDGDGVIVFEGRGAGDRDGVYARRISAAGAPIGADFRVNETTRERQGDASVAMRPDGSFVVVWAGRGRGDQDGIFMRLFAAGGTPTTGEILVNQSPAGRQGLPAVGFAPDGSIVVAWEGNGAGDVAGIFARRFSPSGMPLAGEALVNAPSSLRQVDPALAMQSDGSFLIAWTTRGIDGTGYDTFARRFSAAGLPVGDELRMNGNRAGDQKAPDVAAADNGAYQVVWISKGAGDDGWDVKQSRVSSAGVPGAEERVHVAAEGDQTEPKIAARPDGSTMVAWTSALPLGSGREVMARDFSPEGVPQQEEFPVAALARGYASGHQFAPSLAIGPDQVLVAWSGRGASDRHGVYMRGFMVDDAGENRPPNLAPIANMTVAAGAELRFTATATDPDGDNLTFSLDPEQAPAGATINPQTGVFTWTPTAAQVGTFTVRVLVTDDGQPPLADSETFTITVAANRAPMLDPIAPKEVAEGSELTFTAIATDPDGNQITFALDPDQSPAGATIDPASGIFRWTPTEEQGGQAQPFTVRILAIDNGTPSLADSETFTVTVTEVNRSPALARPENRQVARGSELVFTATATDPDLPANTLLFSLDPETDAPGATINATSGEFHWPVPAVQAPGDYTIRIIVADNADPALADSESFVVTVV